METQGGVSLGLHWAQPEEGSGGQASKQVSEQGGGQLCSIISGIQLLSWPRQLASEGTAPPTPGNGFWARTVTGGHAWAHPSVWSPATLGSLQAKACPVYTYEAALYWLHWYICISCPCQGQVLPLWAFTESFIHKPLYCRYWKDPTWIFLHINYIIL